MKRYGNLFEAAFSRENIYQAYIDARRGKRSRRACFEFEKHLGLNLEMLHDEIHSGVYTLRPYHEFVVYAPKKRLMHAPAFRDIVVQHAIYRVIYNIFDRSFIATSFACRIGHGTHRSAWYTRSAMRQCAGDSYTLKLDIRKFFYSIDRGVLKSLIARKIKDSRMVDMMMLFAETSDPVGIPIGNLLSQLYALIYLNPLDHMVKRILKIRRYVRYVDDFLLIGLTRAECLAMKEKIIEFLKNKLRLVLSKSTIQKVRKGVNFCGYRMWRSCLFIRKYSLFKFRRSVMAGKQESVASLLGHAKHTNSITFMINFLREEISHGKNLQIPKSYKRLYDDLSGGAGLSAAGA